MIKLITYISIAAGLLFGASGLVALDARYTGSNELYLGARTAVLNLLNNTLKIDVTSDEAFLVRKDGDSGDVFVVDTNGADSGITATGVITLASLDCTGNTNGGALTADGTGIVSCSDDDSGSTAAGSTGEIQFNDYSSLGADADFVLATSTNSLAFPIWYASTTLASPAYRSGQLFFDSDNDTLSFHNSEADITLQLGQEMWLRAANDTGSTITNGQVVFISSASSTAALPNVTLAKADLPTTSDRVIGIATHDVEAGTVGHFTTFGSVRNINTSAFGAGNKLYLSGTTAGALTDTRPAYPNYIITVGSVVTSDASGEISVNVSGRIEDIIDNAFNGAFVETINFTIATSSGDIVGSLANSSSTQDLTMRFSDGFTILDTTPATTTILTAGSATVPTINYIYITKASKALLVSTTGWPDEEHIKVSTAILRTAIITGQDGALGNRNWNDHLSDSNSYGHINDIAERVRAEHSKWWTGVAPTVTITSNGGAADNVDVALSAGTVYQLHLQTFPAMDSGASDDFHVANDSVAAYDTISDLNSLLTDADGDSMSGKNFNLVLWGVQNKTGQTSHMMINLPTCSYNTIANAINDINNCDILSIPDAFRGTGFLIARFTFSHIAAASGTWTLESTKNLRGVDPNPVGGGGTTSNITNFSDNQFTVFDDGDSTRIGAFDLGSVTTGNTRTVVWPDAGGTMALTSNLHDAVTLAGTPNYLTLSSQQITLTVLDVSDDTNLAVSGTLLDLTDDTLSINEGTLTDTKVCTYEAGTGIECNTTVTGSPGGADTQVQYNTLGSFGGDAGMTYNSSTNILSVDVAGALTGNADTATASADNPDNCAAGSYPLGVDANWDVESCTDASTEIDSIVATHTSDNDAHQALVTLAGTPNYLTLSGQAITLTVLDLSDDTNLTVTSPITLTADDIGFDQTADLDLTGSITSTLFQIEYASDSSKYARFGVNAAGDLDITNSDVTAATTTITTGGFTITDGSNGFNFLFGSTTSTIEAF